MCGGVRCHLIIEGGWKGVEDEVVERFWKTRNGHNSITLNKKTPVSLHRGDRNQANKM